MQRFFVSTGGMQETVEAETPQQAIDIAMERFVARAEGMGLLTICYLAGFDMLTDHDVIMSTTVGLERIGFVLSEDGLYTRAKPQT